MSKHRGRFHQRRWFGLVTVAAVAAGVLLGGPALARRVGFDVNLPWSNAADATCATTTISVVVAPEILSTVNGIIQPVQGAKLGDGHCLQAMISAESPQSMIDKAHRVSGIAAPQLWIPDSSLWMRQIDAWPLQSEGSFASSPLVLATSASVVAGLGWTAHPPTWAQALSGVRPVAMPDLQNNASGVLAVLGLWQTLNRGRAADQAVAAAVLASTRSISPTPANAVDKAVKNDPATPLLVTSELNVFSTNRSNRSSQMVAVYPSGGSPSLDYPILRISAKSQGTSRSIATDTVVAALEGAKARERVRRDGLRDTNGTGVGGPGISTDTVVALQIPDPAQTTAFLNQLASLLRPSHMTVVVDVSGSMNTLIGGKLTRAQLAGRASYGAGQLMSDHSSVALWIFSRNLSPGVNYKQLDNLVPLGDPEAGHTHRDVLNGHLLSLPNFLGGDGTALYGATLAAMKYANGEYDQGSVNSVVLFTDGVNDDKGGPGLAETVAQLQQLANPQRPVRLIAVGIGPDADLGVLQQLAAPSGGMAYVATTPQQLNTVLFDALAHRQK